MLHARNLPFIFVFERMVKVNSDRSNVKNNLYALDRSETSYFWTNVRAGGNYSVLVVIAMLRTWINAENRPNFLSKFDVAKILDITLQERITELLFVAHKVILERIFFYDKTTAAHLIS